VSRGVCVGVLMPRTADFRSTIISLWFRLTTLGIIALVFSEALILAPGKAQGWTYYLSVPEVAFEVVVRLVAAALAGIAIGTMVAILIAPIVWLLRSWRERVSSWTLNIAVILAVFLVARLTLKTLIKWSYSLSVHPLSYDKALYAAFLVAFVAALLVPRSRTEILTSLDGFQSERATRLIIVTTIAATVALVVIEYVFSKATPIVKAAVPQQRPKSNILLITFDALDAEDMSLYGREFPTTPNIDTFAGKATVFKNFFSASTFTTSSVASMLTGTYPSDNYVFQLQGQLRSNDLATTLPRTLQEGGYLTACFLSNPYAYYFTAGLRGEFDIIPEPHFQGGSLQRLWDASTPLHQNSGVGSRIDEYFDLENAWGNASRMPENASMRFRPAASFDQAREVLEKLPNGYFLWIHVITPHNPYLPDAVDRGRFLPDSEHTTYEEESGNRWKPHYPANQQSLVNQRRLRYDEFIATADRAFGAFMSEMESAGKLQNTTVIVSADHGESFDGGVYQHSSPDLTRPVIHIPLIISTPGQQERRTISVTADQTSLAPTILELAGVPKPDRMSGPSLARWLNDNGQGDGEGLAFTQYFERNSVFQPLQHGSIGVIDGQYQYVYYLETRKGELRPLDESQIWNLDRSAENPERAKALHAALHSRFPDLIP
jgi:arylsulfatase A-like enzyme